MKHLLNTLYITSLDAYLSIEGESIIIATKDKKEKLPLCNIDSIVSFGYSGISPALMFYCIEHSITIVFCEQFGHAIARINGITNGNVLLRKEQFRVSDDEQQSLYIAKNMITSKMMNQRKTLCKAIEDHPYSVDTCKMTNIIESIKQLSIDAQNTSTADELRGIEGKAAELYFSVFDEMILQNKKDFIFNGRNKRPPTDFVNALLSFAYSLMSNDCATAIESVGLDSYVGFFHTDRPGRKSLALDIVEELRSPFCDRFVLSLINLRIVSKKDFVYMENGAVYLTDSARKIFLQQWQKKKQEIITHPFIKEKIEWGLVPYVQALLLSRYLRKNIDEYPPFIWR